MIHVQKEIRAQLQGINHAIKDVLHNTNYAKYGELDIERSHDPNEQFLIEEYSLLLEQLSSIHSSFTYLEKPILAEGTLYRNANGRFEINSEVELTSGSRVEFLSYDDFYSCHEWRIARIEHADDYYLFGFKEVSLDGLTVRVR